MIKNTKGTAGHISSSRKGHFIAAAVAGAVALTLSSTWGQDAQGPAGPAGRPGGMMGAATRPTDDSDSPMQVYIPDSFAAQDKLNRAIAFERKDQVTEALQAYQEVIDDFGDKMTRQDSNTYVSILETVRHRLQAMPAVKAGQYDALYSVEAEAAIKKAVAERDLQSLIKACDRFYIATAAVKGLETAAAWEFERGEFSMAARLWMQLSEHPRADAGRAEYLHHAALAAHMDGNEDLAKSLTKRLDAGFSEAMAIVDGKNVNLRDNLIELLAIKPWDTSAIVRGEWPTFQGNAARSAVPDVSSTAGAKLWSVVLDEDKSPARALPGRAGLRVINGMPEAGPQLSSFAVMSQDVLYVHNGDQLLAMSAASGGLRWTYPAAGAPGTRERMNGNVNQQFAYNNGMIKPSSLDSPTIYGDQIFAILPAASQSPRNGRFYGQLSQNSKLVALDKNGQEAFKPVVAGDLEIAKSGSVAFVGSPVVTAHGIFVLARRNGTDSFTNLYLVRLNRATGAVDWTVYLCGAASGTMYGGMQTQFETAAVPAFADDTVYVATGQGVDIAIDAGTGRARWLALTDLARQPKGVSNYGQLQPSTPAWKFNAPIVVEDKLVTLEAGSAFRVYDRWTGKVLLHVPVDKSFSPDLLAGVINNAAILVGKDIRVLSLKNGKDLMEPAALPKSEEAGKLQGRPFLSKKYLYLPMEKGLAMLDLEKGLADQAAPDAQLTAWPKDEKGVQAKPGNLLVTAEQVIVVNDTEAASYSTWETARDSRLAAIKANPNDPDGYLSLSEVAFRTAHFDISRENMDRAVQLAVAKGLDKDITQQVYRTCLVLAEQLATRGEEERPLSRFFYDQASKTAGTPEANAEWRLSLSGLALMDKKPAEAATLFNEVLVDSAMRNATLHAGDNSVRAGNLAEASFKKMIETQPDAYVPVEQQAAAMLLKVHAGQDPAAYQNLVDSYPNSKSALTAAAELAGLYGSKGSFDDANRTLRWLYTRVTTPAEKARVAVDLANTNASMKRFETARSWIDRGRRLAPELTWTEGGRTVNFADLRTSIRAKMPDLPDARRPTFSVPMDETLVKLTGGKALEMGAPSAGNARLMVPMETIASARRPDLIAVQEGRTIRVYNANGLTEHWNVQLGDASPAVLLGYTSGQMVVLQPRKVTILDLNSGTTKGEIALDMDNNEIQRHQMEVSQLQNSVIQMLQQNPQTQQNWSMYQTNGDGEFLVNSQNYGGQIVIDAQQAHDAPFRQFLGGAPAFNAVRLLGSRITIVTGNRLNAYDAANGKHLWDTVTLPAGCVQAVVGNEDLIVAEVDKVDVNPQTGMMGGGVTFVAINADTGKKSATVQLDEHMMWRAVGDGGMLTCVTEEGISCYDLMGDCTKSLWRKDNVHAINSSAIAMGLDGVAVVNRNNELVCLGLEDGEQRFQPRRVNLGTNVNGIQNLRLIADGETMIVQSAQAVEAYRTNDGSVAWKGVFSEPPPPLVASQLSENHIAVLGSGMVNGQPVINGQMPNALKIIMFNRVDPRTGELSNGKNELEKPLRRTANKADPSGPNLQRWEVVDGGICMDISGSVFVYRCQAAEKQPPTP